MPDHLLPTLPAYYDKIAEILPAAARAYFLGAAGAGATAQSNLAAFENCRVTPRALGDVAGGSTALSLLGRPLPHPILIAPFAYQTLLDPAGEMATAQGAQAQEATMILSAQSATPMEDVRAAGDSCRWFQLYWLGRRQTMQALIERAQNAGFDALVLTVDAPVQGVRDAEIAAGFRLPDGVGAINLAGLAPPDMPPLPEGGSVLFDQLAQVSMGWDDVAWLVRETHLPVIVKGILHPDDARRALDAGAQGVVVSNHGGRVFDRAPASLSALPKVAAAVGTQIPVLMDGGIRRGIDVFIARALGAQAVLVGHPIVAGLGVAGAVGVSHVLRLLRDELEVAMMLTGCKTLADIRDAEVYFTE